MTPPGCCASPRGSHCTCGSGYRLYVGAVGIVQWKQGEWHELLSLQLLRRGEMYAMNIPANAVCLAVCVSLAHLGTSPAGRGAGGASSVAAGGASTVAGGSVAGGGGGRNFRQMPSSVTIQSYAKTNVTDQQDTATLADAESVDIPDMRMYVFACVSPRGWQPVVLMWKGIRRQQ
eukprot:GHVU01187188.1.p1 GENE.GHVU01187188.1~~GHVU01187188.1.p1  ORF type:complete len:175 (+),score=18.63 GHVU01187188.1:460-984(+)